MPRLCPICNRNVNDESVVEDGRLVELEKKAHQEIARVQKTSAVDARKDITNGSAIVVMDFSSFKVKVVSGNALFIDVLVPLAESRYHEMFVFLSTHKEDVSFVQGGVRVVLTALRGRTDTILVYSDGAPTHFKNKHNFYAWMDRRKENSWIQTLELRFFAPYHGSYVCDGAAATLNRKLRNTQMDAELVLKSLDDVCSVAKSIHGWNVRALKEIEPTPLAPRSLNGMKRFFVWCVEPDALRVYADMADDRKDYHVYLR